MVLLDEHQNFGEEQPEDFTATNKLPACGARNQAQVEKSVTCMGVKLGLSFGNKNIG
jgi:hypothetical protein